jgi:thiol:disulfide interchange protein
MQRRHFLALAAVFALAPALFAARVSAAGAAAPLSYTPELLAAELAAGRTVVLDFAADWCPSCKAQGRAIQALRADDPAYDAGLVFMVADWDKWGKEEIARRLDVTGRGAVVILKGDAIVARSDTHLQKAGLKALLDTALAAGA